MLSNNVRSLVDEAGAKSLETLSSDENGDLNRPLRCSWAPKRYGRNLCAVGKELELEKVKNDAFEV
jgi:hypothetical protein